MPGDTVDYGDIIAMDENEIDIFLEEQHLGVLSLCSEGEPYGIPLCYVHDEDTDTIYFNFGEHDDSKKIRFIENNPRASFTVYDLSAGTHLRSVVISGTMSRVTDDEEHELAQELLLRRNCAAPLYFWGVSSKDLEFPYYKLDIEEKHGRDSEIEFPEEVKDRIAAMIEKG